MNVTTATCVPDGPVTPPPGGVPVGRVVSCTVTSLLTVKVLVVPRLLFVTVLAAPVPEVVRPATS